MIANLTGMDVANASVYDGASAAAEATNMCRDRKRNKALVSGAANPMVIDTIKTYCFGNDSEVELIPLKDGQTDINTCLLYTSRSPADGTSPKITLRM